MNKEKLRELFREYVDACSSDSALWEASEAFEDMNWAISMAKTPEDKCVTFIERSNELSLLFPSLDWSVLSVLPYLEPTMVVEQVLYYINSRQAEARIVSYLQGLVDRIRKGATAIKAAVPPNAELVQGLSLLRFIRDPKRNKLVFPSHYDYLSSLLDCRTQRSGDDGLGMQQFYALFESMEQEIISFLSEELDKISVSAGPKKLRFASRYEKANAITGHFLLYLVNSSTVHPVAGDASSAGRPIENRALGRLLTDTQETIATLAPQIDFLQTETAYFQSRFARECNVEHQTYGPGVVARAKDDIVTIRFSSGEIRNFPLLKSILSGKLFIDELEYHKRLFFSRDVLKRKGQMEKELADARERLQDLMQGGSTQKN
ncbi:MAG: hypothetical protein IKM73_08135 [Acidaminococcaceae bacterium]|nr:hypothetical protein [Acidaminococcaceae bacterium]